MNMNMNVKQAAERSGVSSRNIRYYEQAGLLSPARDPGNDYRVYTEADVHTLKLIRMLRTLDMPIEEIHAVLDGSTPLPHWTWMPAWPGWTPPRRTADGLPTG